MSLFICLANLIDVERARFIEIAFCLKPFLKWQFSIFARPKIVAVLLVVCFINICTLWVNIVRSNFNIYIQSFIFGCLLFFWLRLCFKCFCFQFRLFLGSHDPAYGLCFWVILIHLLYLFICAYWLRSWFLISNHRIFYELASLRCNRITTIELVKLV